MTRKMFAFWMIWSPLVSVLYVALTPNYGLKINFMVFVIYVYVMMAPAFYCLFKDKSAG